MQAENMAKKHQTRNPYELLDAIGAKTILSDQYSQDGLKGFSTIINRQMFAFINAKLDEHERMIVAGHEAAHLILHKREILQSPACAIKDFNLYDNSGRLEYEANDFLANFLVSDKRVLESISNSEGDYFFTAKELCIPPPLLAFKLHGMMHRGFEVRNPMNLESKFFGRKGMWQS